MKLVLSHQGQSKPVVIESHWYGPHDSLDVILEKPGTNFDISILGEDAKGIEVGIDSDGTFYVEYSDDADNIERLYEFKKEEE